MPDQTNHGRTKTGVELTDDALDKMEAEAERGLDTARLRRRPGRPSMGSAPAETFAVRLDPELRQALDHRAEHDETTASEVIRAALRRYLQMS